MHKYFAPRMVRGLNDDEEEVFPLNVRSGTQELTTQFQYETTCDFDESRNHFNMSIRSDDIKNYSPDAWTPPVIDFSTTTDLSLFIIGTIVLYIITSD